MALSSGGAVEAPAEPDSPPSPPPPGGRASFFLPPPLRGRVGVGGRSWAVDPPPARSSKNRATRPIGIAPSCTSVLPPTRTARARGFKRAPRQSGQVRL